MSDRIEAGTDGQLSSDTSTTISVLHVDDEPDFTELAAMYLEQLDERFEVTPATSVETAMTILESGGVDCVVSDYDMPETNGIEFLETVRERYGEIPFVLFTGRGSEEVASEAISAGVSDYLRKKTGPDQFSVLANRIENIVSRHRAERRLDAHLARTTDAFYALDHEWRFSYVNERAAAMLDRDREAILGAAIWEAFPDTIGTELESAYRAAVDTGDTQEFEFRYEPLDTDFEVHAYPSETGLSIYFRDVTERKQRERELREVSERLSLAVEGANVGVWDWDLRTDTVTFDEGWAEMLGYDLDEIAHDLSTWEARVHPDDIDGVWEVLEAHLSGETDQYECDHRMRAKSGEWRWIRDRGRVVERAADGEPQRAVGIHIDVTERKERQRDLERYRRMVNAMPESVCLYDADGRFLFANEYLLAEYGVEREAMLGSKSRLVDRIRESADGDPFAELAAGDRQVLSDTVAIDLPDHADAVIDYRLSPIFVDGEFDAVLGIGRDVTEARRREAELERTSARLEALFERSPDMMDIHDVDGEILEANASICRELGYERDDLVGMSVPEIDAEIDPSTTSEHWEELAVDETKRVETTYRRADGSAFPVEVHVRRIDVNGEDRFLASSRDVTERKAYQRQIERENERLDEFASIVSHDLRNPLNVLSGFLGLARETGDPDHFDRCERALDDMEQLIDDVLTLARQGRTVGEPETIALDEFARKCLQNVDSEGLRLVVDDDAAIQADPGRLKQLLENLFRNALDHANSPTTVTVGCLDAGFYVADDGPGIPEEERDRVFESGYTTSDTGTGFGLAIVEQIADAHGWTVSIPDGDAGGACFEFTGVDVDDDADQP
ncbi:MAG: PAS domain S-box protein [Halorubrum sp.]